MTNILLHSLNKYYKEMMSLEGKIFVLNGFVKNFRDDLQKRETIDRELMGAISVSQASLGQNTLFVKRYQLAGLAAVKEISYPTTSPLCTPTRAVRLV